MSVKLLNKVPLFMLALLFCTTGSFAAYNFSGDCINDDIPDKRCVYLPLDQGQTIGLYVEDPPKSGNKLKGADVYIYAPNAGTDSIIFSVNGKTASNGEKFISNDVGVNPEGYVVTSVVGHWTMSNAELGVSASASMEDVNVIYVYNFYVPKFEFCEDANCDVVISDISDIQLNVGDTLQVYVQSVIPLGPSKGKLDTLAKDLQYFLSSKHETLKFLTSAKTPMGKGTIAGVTYYVGKLSNSRASFLVTSDKAISDVNFTLNASMYTPNGDTIFRAVEDFPGNLQFVNYGLPTLDSASIFDTNGDGIGDSMAVYFNGQMDGVSLENFKYNWPTGEDFIEFGGNFFLKEHIAELTGVKTNIPDSIGKGELKVDASSSVSGASGTLSGNILDRIGPVIQKANLVKGEGKQDTLVLTFNKAIDESWTSGSGFLLNGVPISLKAVEKGVEGNHRIWKFVIDKNLVKTGDEIEIATTCAKGMCPDGLVKARDGNPTGKNNPATITDSGRNYVDNEKNGFYDSDGDGRMDSATVAFETPLTKNDLKNMEVTLYWADNQGNVLKITPDLTDTNIVKLSKDGLILQMQIDADKYDVKKMLTSIDTVGIDVDSLKYGFAKITKPVVQANGDTLVETYNCTMHDKMSPVISETFLEPESFQKMEADVLTISFSEPVDKSTLEDLKDLSDCFSFKVDGNWVSIPFTSLEWSKDGKSVKLHLENGVALSERLNPADSLKFDLEKVSLTDLSGNGVSSKSPAVMVKGDPRVLMESTSLATLDRATLLKNKAAFTERFVDADEPMDEEMQKSLGVLMDISFATVMGKDSSGIENVNFEDVGLSWELKVFTNLGAYVGGASNKIKCSDKVFEGNCFEHAKKMYLRWNMRSHEGRKVGVGVYVAQFKINVYGAKNSFKVERIYNWGIRAGKDGMKLGD